jgi:ABC transport system ATP-binding/permease protein
MALKERPMAAPSPSFLSAKDLTLSFGPQRLLEGVTFSVAPGEKVGLVGRNGCGKTTLLKLLTGLQEAESGEISRRRGLRIGYLPQEFELDGTKTIRENIEAGAADLVEALTRYEAGDGTDAELEEFHHRIDAADGWNFESRMIAEASALGTPPLDTLVGPLSGGEKRRVALCRALAAQPDLLLLDEPTNHLDSESIRWLEEFLHDFPGAVIFITHDRYFLDVIATRILEIFDGRCYSHPGNYTSYLESKAIRQEIAEVNERRRQRFLKVELEWVRSGVKARTTKPKHRMDSFYAIAGQEAPLEEREMDILIPPPPDMGNIGVDLENVGARSARARRSAGSSATSRCPCARAVHRRGGPQRRGQDDPAEDLPGRARAGRGLGGDRQEGRRQPHRPGAHAPGSFAHRHAEIEDGDQIVMFGGPNGQKMPIRAYLRRFLFADDRVKDRVGDLSGGERARLMLAKVLKRGGNLLVLDEPTNDLDLPSLRMLEEAIVNFDGTVLVVSHDRYFLDRVCDQIVAFEDGGVFLQPGNYSYYLQKRKEREAKARVAAQPVKPAAARIVPLTASEQRELKGMEAAIQAAEARVLEIESVMAAPEFYTAHVSEVRPMTEKLAAEKATVAKMYERWQELEARKG